MAKTSKNVSVVDIDKGWKRLGMLVHNIPPKYVDVGVMAKHDARSDEVGNVALALIHEYGLGNVPERSFIRDTIDDGKTEYMVFIKQLAWQIIAGRITKTIALTLLGAKVEADMKDTVEAGIMPELSEQTIQKKGSDLPLVDTGQLINSIDYEIVK